MAGNGSTDGSQNRLFAPAMLLNHMCVCHRMATDGNYRPKPLTFHWACKRILLQRVKDSPFKESSCSLSSKLSPHSPSAYRARCSGLAVAHSDFDPPQQDLDLPGLLPLDGHERVPVRWILSLHLAQRTPLISGECAQ